MARRFNVQRLDHKLAVGNSERLIGITAEKREMIVMNGGGLMNFQSPCPIATKEERI